MPFVIILFKTVWSK